MYGIGPKLPIKFTKQGTPLNTLTIRENTQQNLKNLILTSPGERIMDIDFGVGLRRYLFENNTPVVRQKLENRIIEQVEKYMPFVDIKGIDVIYSDNNPNVMDIKLRYGIRGIASEEILSLSLDPKITS